MGEFINAYIQPITLAFYLNILLNSCNRSCCHCPILSVYNRFRSEADDDENKNKRSVVNGNIITRCIHIYIYE
jgi:hypothetical protein